jgi:hypothetical protein
MKKQSKLPNYITYGGGGRRFWYDICKCGEKVFIDTDRNGKLLDLNFDGSLHKCRRPAVRSLSLNPVSKGIDA